MDKEDIISYASLGRLALFFILCYVLGDSVSRLSSFISAWMALGFIVVPFYLYRMIQIFHDDYVLIQDIVSQIVMTLVIIIGGIVHAVTDNSAHWQIAAVIYSLLLVITIADVVYLILYRRDTENCDLIDSYYDYILWLGTFGHLAILGILSIAFTEDPDFDFWFIIIPFVSCLTALILNVILFYLEENYNNTHVSDLEERLEEVKEQLNKTILELTISTNKDVANALNHFNEIIDKMENEYTIAADSDNSITISCTNDKIEVDADDDGNDDGDKK